MAKLFLETGDATTVSSPVSVFGGTGAETLKVASGAIVTVDPNVDRIEFGGNSADYKFEVEGTKVKIYSGATLVATTGVQGDTNGTVLAFADGSGSLLLTGLDAATFGGKALVTTDGGAVVSSPTLNTSDKSTVTPPVTTPTFSVAGAASVTEGSSATFTVSLSAAQGTTSTVTYALAGTGGAVLGTDTGTATPAGAGGTLTFAPGETSKTIVVPFTFDTTTEAGEGVNLTLSAPSTGITLGTSTVTTAIADPAAPTFTLTSNAVAGLPTEEGQTITYTITPSSITDKAYTFTFSTQGDTLGGVAAAASASDFSPAAVPLTFAAGTTTPQTVLQAIVNDGIIEGLEGYKTSLLDSTNAAIASKTGTITDPTSGSGSGTTYTLTTGTDAGAAFGGTTGNDTFIGTASDTAAATDTFTAVDVLGGGLGTDTLNVTFTGVATATTLPAATVSGIETINVRGLQTTAATITTVTTANFAGALDFNADRATSAVTFSTLAAGQSFGMIGNGAVANGALVGTYANTVTSGVINIAGGTTATAAATITENGTGITSNTINSTGAANAVNAIVLSGAANTALTINAATSLQTGGITGFTGTTSKITVAGAATNITNGVAVALGTIEAATVGTIDASGLTAGGISATLSANTALAVTGGKGNDFITTGAVLTTGSVAAGDGTADRLILNANADIATAALGAKYTGFEVVSIGTGGTTLDLDNLAAGNTLTGLRITGSTAGTGVTNINAATAANVTETANSTFTLGVKGALTPGQIDTIGLTVSDGLAAVNTITVTAPTIAGVEILNLVATDHITVTSLANALALTNINVSGAGNVSLTTTAIPLQTNFNINAGTATGNLTVNGTGETTNGFGVTGSSGINTITGGDQIFSANLAASTAKADVITLTNATGGTLALQNASLTGFTNSASVLAGDHLELAGVAVLGRAGVAVAATATATVPTMTAAVSATGIITFAGAGAATATLADKINAALETTFIGNAILQTGAFEHGGNTYIVENGDAVAGYLAGTDYVVALVGVTGLTALSTTASGATTAWVS